jgi:phage terminase large subunit
VPQLRRVPQLPVVGVPVLPRLRARVGRGRVLGRRRRPAHLAAGVTLGKFGKAAATLKRWARDPIAYVVEDLHATPDAWQAAALRAVGVGNKREIRLALKACKGPGKTTVLAWIVLWFLTTRHQAKILCTSITEANLHANLWPEINKWLMRSDVTRVANTWTKTRVSNVDDPGNWFAEARTWPKKANAEQQADSLAGHHADHVMAVADESGGYPQSVMVALEAIFSSCVEGILVQSGNPTHTQGPLYRACTIDRHLWTVVTITGDPDDPQRSPRIGLEWARQQIASYGRDNPWVMVNVLGQFPPSSINALLGVEEVEAAMKRHLLPHQYEWQQKRLGVDVARFGDDRTVIFPRQGLASFRPIVMRVQNTMQIAARVMRASVTWQPEIILIDDTGHWGHGVLDALTTAHYNAIGINYSEKAINPRYKNRRCEFWLEGAKAIRAGAALPYIPELIPELTEPTYTYSNGVWVMEDKDQIKARLGRSPDLGDAYMQTYALPEMPGQMREALGTAHTTAHDGDPYAGLHAPSGSNHVRTHDDIA